MANTAQSKKRARQNERHRQRNAPARSMMRTHIKGLKKAVLGGESNEKLQSLFQSTSSAIDKLARKRLIHPNTAARYKRRLNTLIKTAQAS